MRFSFPMPFLLVITILTATTVKAQSVSSLSLDAKWLAVKGISQPLSMDGIGRLHQMGLAEQSFDH
jgi:hypothetical protein